MDRKAYPSDVSGEEWALVAPYLTLMTEDAPQRDFPLREVFNGLRWIVRTGAPWRLMPHDPPPYYVVYQQSQRWIKAGVFESLVHDLHAVLRIADGRKEAQLPQSLIVELCNPRLRAEGAQAMTEPNAGKAVRSIWRSIRLGICWPCV
jgi:transposase